MVESHQQDVHLVASVKQRHELAGSEMPDIGEVKHDDIIDTAIVKQLSPFLRRGDEWDMCVGYNNSGVLVESDNERTRAALACNTA